MVASQTEHAPVRSETITIIPEAEREGESAARHVCDKAAPGALRHAAARAVGWNAAAKVGTQALQMGVKVILARLLAPGDFGLLGMAAIVAGLVGLLRDLGLGPAIVQRKDLDDGHLSSAFWSSLALGLLLAGAGISCAPLAAMYFGREEVKGIVGFLSVGLFISSVGMVPAALLTRNLNFRKLALRDLLSAVINGGVAIPLAVAGFGVWSLVWGALAGTTASVASLWLGISWTPSMAFSASRLRQLLGFGANVTGTSILLYAARNADYFIIGRWLGATSLGLYTLAYNVLLLPLRQISWSVTPVAFSAFSRIQDDIDRFRSAYLATVRYISTLAFPVAAGMFAVAPELVHVVLGSKWEGAILPVRIFCPLAALQAVATTTGTVYQARGRPDIQLKWGMVAAPVLIGCVILGLRWGIVGVAAATAIGSLGLWPVGQSIANRLIELPMRRFACALGSAAAGSGLMLGVLLALKRWLLMALGAPDALVLIVLIAVGMPLYCVLMSRIPGSALGDVARLIRYTLHGEKNKGI